MTQRPGDLKNERWPMKAPARFLVKHHQDIRYQALIDFHQLPLLVQIAPVEILLKLRSIR